MNVAANKANIAKQAPRRLIIPYLQAFAPRY
jgi:hypothetical protein